LDGCKLLKGKGRSSDLFRRSRSSATIWYLNGYIAAAGFEGRFDGQERGSEMMSLSFRHYRTERCLLEIHLSAVNVLCAISADIRASSFR